MSRFAFPAKQLRASLIEATVGEGTTHGDEAPRPEKLYVPVQHVRALHPDNMLVVGMRGSGKTYWWNALQDADLRKRVAARMPQTGLGSAVLCTPGFGAGVGSEYFPGKRVLQSLTEDFDPQQIWRTVIAWQVLGPASGMPSQGWKDRVQWIEHDPERSDRALSQADRQLRQEGKQHLVLFDALDRSADKWEELAALLRGLLQILLEFRAFKAIRPKAFVRPDMLTDSAVTSFPDASKVTASRVELAWPRAELFNLLWQYLANEPGEGSNFRVNVGKEFHLLWRREEDAWTVPERLKRDERLQREVFHAIAGPWMGRDARRGFPYTWLPNHLGDAFAQTSPRSFIAALNKAAEVSRDQYSNHSYALHYESIKSGVQHASQIRVEELKEEYPWVEMAMRPLRGLVVPCTLHQIASHWKREKITEKLEPVEKHGSGLPPRRLGEGSEGIAQDLVELGIFQTMHDLRINVPDVYRVGYGLGRRGGVVPVR